MSHIFDHNSPNILSLIQSQLAIDLNCTTADLNGEPGTIIFTEARDNPGRRPFPRGERHFELLSMGSSIVVCASSELLAVIQPALTGKTRDEIFAMPFIYSLGHYYLPDLKHIVPLPAPTGFSCELVEREDIPALYHLQGFENSIGNGSNHPRPDALAVIAKAGDAIIGMAGASEDCATMWQVGIDVLPAYRNRGMAAYLVNRLTIEILRRGVVPYYGTSSANIASQRTAHRAGYSPAWVCSYKGRFEGHELQPTC